MDHDRLFRVLVMGGAALTLAGCSSSDAPSGPAPAVDSGASADTAKADSGSGGDSAKPDSTTPTTDSSADSISSFDADDSGDGGTCVDMSVCKWDGGIPFCDGMCCIWGAAHPCCAPFMAKDAGGD